MRWLINAQAVVDASAIPCNEQTGWFQSWLTIELKRACHSHGTISADVALFLDDALSVRGSRWTGSAGRQRTLQQSQVIRIL